MPYFGNKLLNPSICVAIKHNSSTSHAKRIIATLAVALLSVLKLLLENKKCLEKCL
jgi:hypothetical protein